MTPVERCALAIAKAIDEDCPDDLLIGPYDSVSVGEGAVYPYDLARAAIEALREPSEAMEAVGDAMLVCVNPEGGCNRADEVWRTMINAALAEKETA